MSDLRPLGIDHVVLVVSDVERSLAWYVDVLGADGERVEAWRAGQVPFPSVRLGPSSILDILAGERTGQNVDHLCVEVAPLDLEALASSGRFDVVGGPAALYGARGTGMGLYVRDPDGNVVEIRHYGSLSGDAP